MLDFEHAVEISPVCMLLLLAEIHRCRKTRPARNLTGTYPTDVRLHRQMQACGFFKLLNVKHRLPEQTKAYPLDYIQFMTGTESVGRDADELRSALLGPRLKWTKAAGDALYRGLTEAMTNVVNHAYPAESLHSRYTRLPNRWWMVGHFNRLRKELRVLFFDQGVGIPKTLPKRFGWEQIRSAVGQLPLVSPNDGEMISAAMTLGRSQTAAGHRGKGLNDFKKLIDACKGGRLIVLSNRGEYQYSYPGSEAVWNYSDSIRGTLIEWSVPLAAIENFNAGEFDGDATEIERGA